MATNNKTIISLLALLILLLAVLITVILVRDVNFNKATRKTENVASDSTNQKSVVEIVPVSSSASSTDLPNYGFTYPPEASYDNDWFTWWTPRGRYEGEWIKYNFDKPRTIRAIKILNGSHWPECTSGGVYYGDLYYHNAILTAATLEFSDGKMVNLKLKIFDGMQTVEFPAVKTSFVRLICREIFPGKTWQDVCISEVKFLSQKMD